MAFVTPLGYRVLVKAVLEKKTKSGIIIAADEKLESGAKDKGVVIAIGKTAGTHPDLQWNDTLKINDEVVWAKYAGKHLYNPDDPEGIYILLNDADILGIVTNGQA